MPADPGEALTPEQVDTIYRTLIRSTLFDASSKGKPTPTLILLGGQPGSGKSRASARLLEEHEGMVAVTGDDLRIFHPQYRHLVTAQPERAGEILAKATSVWVRTAIKDALEGRQDLLLEGTFGDPEVTLATARQFREAGFHVRIVAIASPRVLSLVTAASRYLRDRKLGSPARFTRLSAHDRGFDGTTRLTDSLHSTEAVDRVTIVSRNGNTLFDELRDPGRSTQLFDGASAALQYGRNPTSWGARSTMELLGELKQITAYAVTSGELTAGVAQVLIEAHNLALSDVASRLSVSADSPQARFILEAVSEQLVAVRRASSASGLDTVEPELEVTLRQASPVEPTQP